MARGRVDERLAETLSKTLVPLLLRLEEALWSGVGGDGARGLVVLADVVRKTDEAHGRVVLAWQTGATAWQMSWRKQTLTNGSALSIP